MTEKTYSILEFNWESVYKDETTANTTFDYYGKLYIKGYEPFRFIGTVIISKEKEIIYGNLDLTSRFYQEIEKNAHAAYISVVAKQAEKNAVGFR